MNRLIVSMASIAAIIAANMALVGPGRGNAAAPSRPAVQSAPTSTPSSQPAGELSLDLGGGVAMKLVLIPAGDFLMGSAMNARGGPVSDKDAFPEEGPRHEVTFSKPFYMGIHEVTQRQYQQVTGKNPSRFKGPLNPVDQVSWVEAMEFCKKLSAKTGRVVSLPTEARWEYACRAGSTTRFYYGDDKDYSKLGDYAWYIANSGGKSHPVGQKKPNKWGLYDMHGNLYEWCADWYAEQYPRKAETDPAGPAKGDRGRVLRGGDHSHLPSQARASARQLNMPENNSSNWGFRVVAEAK